MTPDYQYNPLQEYGFDIVGTSGPTPPDGGGVTWSDVVGTSASSSDGSGLLFKNPAISTVSLPVTTTPGNLIEFANLGGGFRITQGSGQKIIFNDTETTSGTGGYLEVTGKGSVLRLLSVGGNAWLCVYSNGGSFNLV